MKRWWGIRHIRYWRQRAYFTYWWFSFGRHYWLIPNQSDLDYLDRIWKGEE